MDTPVNEQHLETGVDEVSHQRGVVSPDCLDTFTVHLVVFHGVGPVQTSVTLFVDQQVREIHL